MSSPILSPISVRLREVRKDRKLTQAELAEKSGVPQSTISRIEAGGTGSITLAHLESLADALGINAALLIVHQPKEKRG